MIEALKTSAVPDRQRDPEFPLIAIDQIRLDGGTQHRQSLDESVVRNYVKLMMSETVFPDLRVWHDGAHYWLTDGFHRLEAAKRAGFKYVTANIHKGSLQEARWDSYGANSQHGLPRKRSDVIAVIKRALSHPNAQSLSNVEISKHLGIPESTVRRWRRYLSSPNGDDAVRVVTRNGKRYDLRVENIGMYRKHLPVTCKTRHQLKQGLLEMHEAASPLLSKLVIAFEAWIFSSGSTAECIAAMETIVAGKSGS